MGGCVSATPEEREAKLRSAAIDRQLRTDLREYENTIKILLLGKDCATLLLFLHGWYLLCQAAEHLPSIPLIRSYHFVGT